MAKTEETEVDLKGYLTKPATSLQDRFADWLMDEDIVGYDPSGAKTKEAAFREGVRLATAMRMVFQASPENRAANEEAKANRGADEAPAPKAKAKKAADEEPVKTAGKKSAKAKAKPVEEDEDEAPAKPKVKKAAKKAARKASDDDEAPF